MTATDIIIKDSEVVVENTNLEEMTKDCTNAIVTFSIIDRGELVYPEKRYATRKMVVFLSNGFCPETVHAHLLDIMHAHNQSLSKSYLYRFRTGKWIAAIFKFKTYLLRSITGFIADSNIIDYRKHK